MVPADLSESVRRALSGRNDLRTVILFGSAVQGRLSGDSDVDIAVAAGEALSAEERAGLAVLVERELGRRTDLLDLHRLQGSILYQVLVKGVVLKNTDPSLLAGFLKRMLFHQSDMMPLCRRMLLTKARRFAYGHGTGPQEARGPGKMRRANRVKATG